MRIYKTYILNIIKKFENFDILKQNFNNKPLELLLYIKGYTLLLFIKHYNECFFNL